MTTYQDLSINQFQQQGYLHVKDMLSKELCYFLTHVLLRRSSESNSTNDDTQVPGCLAVLDHEILMETVLERLWPDIELATGKNLLPTYAYSRLYCNGNVLERHSDRPACEISVTIQLGRSHHYAWPIWMNNKRIDMAEGDAVIYRGCDLEHWRDACDGPDGYYSGQVFLHFVDQNGPYADHAYDTRVRKVYNNIFVKNRSITMDAK